MDWIYFVQRVGEGVTRPTVSVGLRELASNAPIKIGLSIAPASRVAQVSREVECALRLVGLERGTAQREADLHKRFSEHARGGEWFEPTSELIEYIVALPSPEIDLGQFECAPAPRRARRAVRGPRFRGAIELDAYLREHGVTVPAFCQAHGFDRHRLQPLLNGTSKRGPGADLILRLEEETGGRVAIDMWRGPPS